VLASLAHHPIMSQWHILDSVSANQQSAYLYDSGILYSKLSALSDTPERHVEANWLIAKLSILSAPRRSCFILGRSIFLFGCKFRSLFKFVEVRKHIEAVSPS